MIDSYQFGKIVVEGKEYSADLIIYPGRIDPGWWRKEGHLLQMENIEAILEAKPEVLIVGTGANGVMKVAPEVEAALQSSGIELIALPTKEACEEFNRLCGQKNVVAALHLTC